MPSPTDEVHGKYAVAAHVIIRSQHIYPSARCDVYLPFSFHTFRLASSAGKHSLQFSKPFSEPSNCSVTTGANALTPYADDVQKHC